MKWNYYRNNLYLIEWMREEGKGEWCLHQTNELRYIIAIFRVKLKPLN